MHFWHLLVCHFRSLQLLFPKPNIFPFINNTLLRGHSIPFFFYISNSILKKSFISFVVSHLIKQRWTQQSSSRDIWEIVATETSAVLDYGWQIGLSPFSLFLETRLQEQSFSYFGHLGHDER